jgi:2-succinyl-5-enolpyruvyl-6-hydroxy-3-cyclohexene-1-carboxylate synthase
VNDTARLNRDQAILIAQTAIEHGVSHAVLSPGARNTPLVLALHDMKANGWPIELHSVIDERAAGFFALGLARITDSPVLLSCTSGSAGANYSPAVVEASESAVPLIVVTADRPEELQDCGAPQTMNQRDLFGAHVRKALHLGTPADETPAGTTHSLIAQAITAATGPHPGPVHINAMFRKPLWAPGGTTPPPSACVPTQSPTIHEPNADRAEPVLDRIIGQRGVIIAGPDSSARIDASGIADLAKRLGWPVLADPVSTVRNADNECVIRHYDALLRSEPYRIAAAPTIAIAFGGTPSSRPLQQLIERTPIVRLDPTNDRWDPWQSVVLHCGCTPSDLAAQLNQANHTPTGPGWLGAWQRANTAAETAIASLESETLWEGPIAVALMADLPEGALLRLASSMPIRDADSFGTKASPSLRVTSNRGVNGIDGLLATTLGEATAHSGPTAVLAGDLSFLHDSGSLSTVPRPHHPVVVIVLDNGGGGIFSYLPMTAHPTGFEPWFTTPHNSDIGAIAEGHGVPVHRPSSLADLRKSWRASLQHQGLSVVHVRIDRDGSFEAHQEAWAAIVSAVEATL